MSAEIRRLRAGANGVALVARRESGATSKSTRAASMASMLVPEIKPRYIAMAACQWLLALERCSGAPEGTVGAVATRVAGVAAGAVPTAAAGEGGTPATAAGGCDGARPASSG